MDERGAFAYIRAVRLLLLLSALLSALTGIAGSRVASAQPVATGACVAGEATGTQTRRATVATVAACPSRFDAAALRRSMPSSFAPRRAAPLYADSLRE